MTAAPRTRRRTAALGALVAVALAGGGVGLAASASSTPVGASTAGAPVAAAQVALTRTTQESRLQKDLRFSREEERLARDLYAALARVHDDARPMSNITRSEQRHFDAIGRLLTRYGISDPSAGRAAGSYAFPELQKLYDGWYAQGSASLAGAYQVGIDLEKRDIADLEKAIERTSQSDARQVFTNLLAGSRNHLRAFERAASTGGAGMGKGGMGQGPRAGSRAGQGPSAGQSPDDRGAGAGMRGTGMGGGAGMRGTGMGGGAGMRGAGPRDGSCLAG